MSTILLVLAIVFLIEWQQYISEDEYQHITKHQTKSVCYRVAKPNGDIDGILITCTEYNDPHLKRYIDFDNESHHNFDDNYSDIYKKKSMPHEFIGYNENNEVVIINTIPYTRACYFDNSKYMLNNYIKICVCKSDIQKKDNYFDIAVRGALVNLCASLCNEHDLMVSKIAVDFPLEYLQNPSEQGGCEKWFIQNQYSIKKFRSDVKIRNTPVMLFFKKRK